jgi:hypothetical protein
MRTTNKIEQALNKPIGLRVYEAITLFAIGFFTAFIVLNTYYAKQSANNWEHNIKHYKYENMHPDSLKMQKL